MLSSTRVIRTTTRIGAGLEPGGRDDDGRILWVLRDA